MERGWIMGIKGGKRGWEGEGVTGVQLCRRKGCVSIVEHSR